MVRLALVASLLLAACSGPSAAVGLQVESVDDPLIGAGVVPSGPGTRIVGIHVTVLNASMGPIAVTSSQFSLESAGPSVAALPSTSSIAGGCDATLAPDERITCVVAFELDVGFVGTRIDYDFGDLHASAPVTFGDAGRPGVDAGRRDAGTDAGTAAPTDELDMLFMVDNSNSMSEEQSSLAAELPDLLSVLGTGDYNRDGDTTDPGDFTPFDIHFGVVTSDMGTGGFTVPTCARSDFGDDGILRTQGRTDIPGCMATYPSFLSFRPGVDAPDETARDLACVATTGTGGCGFEQQLEAILKALSPSAPTAEVAPGYAAPVFFRNTFGHGDTNNDGFLRRDSVLAIVAITDEEDCSAIDPELFNPSSLVYGATDLNLRCFAHADAALHPIERFVDGFLQLRRFPGRLVYAPIAGVPEDLIPAPGEPTQWDYLASPNPAVRDDRLEERVDPAMPSRLIPSCNVPGRGVAFPPIRFLQVGRELEARGAHVAVGSICQESFAVPIDAIIRAARASGR